MKRYFREESKAGPVQWVTYLEFDGRCVSRHLDVCPKIVIMYSEFERAEITVEEMDPQAEISPSEFEETWKHYSKVPHGTRRTDHPLVRHDFTGVIKIPPIELVVDEE